MDSILKERGLFVAEVEALISSSRDDEETCLLCEYLARFASMIHTGRYRSSAAEQALCGVAQRYHTGTGEYRPGTVLHVMTEAHPAGGHTRVVERWISFAPEGQVHGVVLTDQAQHTVPRTLIEETSGRGGDVIVLRQLDRIARALSLRSLASGFEHVVLHTHMYDILPILAFGTPEFTRPVMLFNHADFLFWLGADIADLVLDISTRGQEITRTKRKIENSRILPVPIPCPEDTLSRDEARALLGLPRDSRIILSIGSPYKYAPDGSLCFSDMACSLVEGRDDYLFLVAGPDQAVPEWKDAYVRTAGKVSALGWLSREQLEAYYCAADLYIESFPIGGGTALLEALAHGLPSYTVEGGLSQFDIFFDYKVSPDRLIPAARRVLDEGAPVRTAPEKVKKMHCREGWNAILRDIIGAAPRRHAVQAVRDAGCGVDEADEQLCRRDINFTGFSPCRCPLLGQLSGPSRKAILQGLLEHRIVTAQEDILTCRESLAFPLDPAEARPAAGGELETLRAGLELRLQERPDDALAHNDLGVVFARQGDREQACRHAERAVAISPVNVTFQKNLADLYLVLMDRAWDALSIYKEIAERDEDDMEAVMGLAQANARLGRFNEAVVHARRLVQADPSAAVMVRDAVARFAEMGKRGAPGAEPPDLSGASSAGKEEIAALCREAAARHKVIADVHDDDYIFRFIISNRSFQDIGKAVDYYFDNGAESAAMLMGLLADLGMSSREIRLLEFDSGYGCVTRHLAASFPQGGLTSCDIHPQAMDFIGNRIGVSTHLSAAVPEDFSCSDLYDAVFALSFFSHMPKSTWRRWMRALLGPLRPGGFLIFATHGSESAKHFGNPLIGEDGFWFRPESEQKDLGTAEYGQTITLPHFVMTAASGLDAEPFLFRRAVWWEHQDLYVMKKT